ncbi:DUF1302 family protein [Halioglobus maricola]|uniref:DUF1302 family protein n=1 Tax=Halioglobus maricola TaxID=2601894 RepID=A0A5P9NL67_9GAMM|nr:DUF1302 family protein [Halioglobus maricola]QFU76571.1 DUF1302 family protein [Halioglobus maricola]
MSRVKTRGQSRWVLGAGLALGLSPQAQALSFDFGDSGEWTLDWDTIVSYSAMWRVEKQDRDKFAFRDTGDLLGDLTRYTLMANSTDGNYNFGREMVQNRISVVTEVDINRDDFGVFARARAYYDEAYDGRTSHRQQDYLSYNSADIYGGDAAFQEFPGGTVDEHRDRLEMLDYFIYSGGELGERLYQLRLGSQVINWGEATFYQGINGLQNRADAIAATTPGVEVKEILLPTGALYGQVDLTDALSFEAYYQYEWKETELNGVGSYLSDRDFLGPGASSFLVALSPELFLVAPLEEIADASDSGQWGAALHWFTDGGTDIGFYYVNAHNKAPAYQLHYEGLIPSSYSVLYFEDIEGIAASFTTVVGGANVQGEVSWKEGMPVVLANGDPVAGDVWAVQVGGSTVLEPTALWDDFNLTFEFAGTGIDSHSNRELRYDDAALAVALRAELAYLNVMPGVDLRLIPFLQHTLDGTVLEAQMAEKATTFNLTLKGVYLNNLSAQVGYTAYFDGGDDNLISDRDNVTFNISYSF